MAGEIEEPFSISFQAESFHSGSVSFGRFEHEPLAWERRSSFSHNRYLEEVEKCSKPGSVIEKKAYFEAHFRKKALLLQGSSESQNGGEDQTCESDFVEDEGYREYQTGKDDAAENKGCGDEYLTGKDDAAENKGYGDESDHISKGSHCHHFDENGLNDADYEEDFCCEDEGSPFDHENEGNWFDHANEGSHSAHFEKSPEGSEYLGEGALMECGREYFGVLSAHETDVLVDTVPGDVKAEETHQSEVGCDKTLISNDKPEKEVKENLDDDAGNIDESFKPRNPSPNTGTTWEVDTANLENGQNHSLKTAIESKASKARLKSLVSPDHSQKNISRDSKVAAKIQVRREKEISGRTKAEKLPLQTATPTRRSMHRSPRKEESERSNAKLSAESKSIKGPMTKKVIEVQPSSSKKLEPIARQTPNRLKQTVNSTKADVKSSAGVFQFKSDERAERRKEFYMKLEEKMHAKEAEMNQIQARRQEMTEAEIKQLRKSLNFKAKPMPSFYHVAATPGSTGNKPASSTMKSAKIRQKSASSGMGVTPRPSSLSKEANKQVLSASGSVVELNSPTVESSQAGTISSTPPTDRHSAPESVARQNVVLLKKEREKEGSNLPKHRMSESGKVEKDHKIGGRPKAGAQRNSGEMVRKNMKSAGIGSGSGMGRLAVVAS
ncbi:protein WVD2-like 7 isoform X2 [Herrania umbratica]|uniref:Protein WVD2-like 7 isoform X2 n=1 Tax=Herrania umbratica TaxID=108875 RepID=A0A6J1B237_9ROSI|nr:protein WVD2-like 7 isoform X2 [Herrania umbratica]